MESDNISLSDILTDSTSKDSICLFEDQKQYLSDNGCEADHGEEQDKVDHRDLLGHDLRNVPLVVDKRFDVSTFTVNPLKIIKGSKLPEPLQIAKTKLLDQSSENDGDKKSQGSIEQRIMYLRCIMGSLRSDLWKELNLWREERQKLKVFQEQSDVFALEEATAAARAAAQAYAEESPLSDEIGNIIDISPEQTVSELMILEYEKKLAEYQDALAFAQAEKRYNMRRQLATNTYRQKLMEVERLCDEELDRIQNNAKSLQPLKIMASQWNSGIDQDDDDKSKGDTGNCQADRQHRS